MANICNNEFYAYSEDKNNIATICKFLKDTFGGYVECNDDSIDACFESRWDFPEVEMDKLFEIIPNKEDIYMRCLSVEYGQDYIAYWKCEDVNGWYQEI